MTVTTDVILVRHGEAECNVTGTVGGANGCTGLSERGRDQVQRLGARLAAEHQTRPFDAFYGTPRQRVIDTTDILGAHLPLKATVLYELRGPDHGAADGTAWYDVKTAFGGPPQHAPDEPYAAGSETWNQYLDRATATLQDLLRRHRGHKILIAAHGETIEAVHVLLLQLSPDARRGVGFVTAHTGLTRWQQHINRFHRETWMLAAHNDTTHLSSP